MGVKQPLPWLLRTDATCATSVQILRSINGVPISHSKAADEIFYTALPSEMSGSKPEVARHPVLYTSTKQEMQSLRPVAVEGGVRYTSTEAEMTALKLEMMHLKDDMRQMSQAGEHDA